MEAILTLLGLIFLVPILVLYSSFSWGFVTTIIYKWYILSLFPNLPVFTWLQFAGIMFFINCFVHTRSIQIKDEYRDKSTQYIIFLFAPWLLLLGAWLFRLFY